MDQSPVIDSSEPKNSVHLFVSDLLAGQEGKILIEGFPVNMVCITQNVKC
jgi:hypothetical protein